MNGLFQNSVFTALLKIPESDARFGVEMFKSIKMHHSIQGTMHNTRHAFRPFNFGHRSAVGVPGPSHEMSL